MPSGWHAGEHHVRFFIDDGVCTLRCKCGWSYVMTPEFAWARGEPWRAMAAAHVDSFRTTDPAILRAVQPSASKKGTGDR